MGKGLAREPELNKISLVLSPSVADGSLTVNELGLHDFSQ